MLKMEQGKSGNYFKWLKSHNIVDGRERSIVLRYRSNTSTCLEPKPNAGHVSLVYMGRTGNMMYQYAGLYGIARRCGLSHVISSDNSLLRLFRLNVTVVNKSPDETGASSLRVPHTTDTPNNSILKMMLNSSDI